MRWLMYRAAGMDGAGGLAQDQVQDGMWGALTTVLHDAWGSLFGGAKVSEEKKSD